jgi:hypothetical protein
MRHYVLVGDYGQNLAAPHYGVYHPGDTYYFLPLTVNLFGLVDLVTTHKKMNCYTYGEDEGKKGANNVASLLIQDLHSRGWIRDNNPSPSLTIIFDNCGGQKKTMLFLECLLTLLNGFLLRTYKKCI